MRGERLAGSPKNSSEGRSSGSPLLCVCSRRWRCWTGAPWLEAHFRVPGRGGDTFELIRETRWSSASKGVGPGIGGKMSLSVLTLEATLTIGSSGPA